MAWRLLVVLIITVACDGNLREGKKHKLVPGSAAISLTSPVHGLVSLEVYQNLSSRDYFRCRYDTSNMIYIEARKWVSADGGRPQAQWMALWFPAPTISTRRTNVKWTASMGVKIFGRVVSQHVAPMIVPLGARLRGSCQAGLLRTRDRLTGSIRCQDFHSDEQDRLASYDLNIEDISCVLSQ